MGDTDNQWILLTENEQKDLDQQTILPSTKTNLSNC